MDKTKVILEKLDRIENLLKGQTDQIFNFSEAASRIGCSKSYLYKLTSQNLVPHYKPRGKRIYFSKHELDEWLLRNPVKTSLSIEQQATDYVVNGKNGGANDFA